MTVAGPKKLTAAFCFLLLFQFTCFSSAFAQHLDRPPAKTDAHLNISSYLQKLEKEYNKGTTADRLVAQGIHSGSPAPDKVSVYLMSTPGARIDETALSDMGAEITKRSGNMIRAQIPANMLTIVADTVSGISFMKAPAPFIPAAIVSQGVNLTGADTYHNAGYDGTGVKVAIIDVGFAGLSSTIVGADVVKVDCTGSACAPSDFSSETDSHGTAVAEIVHDMAPGAQLFLIKISDTMDLKDAKDYAIQNGINIINLSGGYLNQNFYDGRCWSISGLPPSAVCTAEDAYAHKILWVNSAGNEAQRHYEAEFSDPDGNGWHNVSDNDESISILSVKAGDTIEVYLTWDAWNSSLTTDQDFNLYLYDHSNNIVASSINTQAGDPLQLPTEKIVYTVPASPNGPYYLAIYNVNAASGHTLELYSVNHDLSPAVAASSLLSPADAAGVMAVGAINYHYWATGPQEPYSSRGPTTDGRTKPDIMGPDHVSNSIEGIFSGTSASSPHVAGAAALILQKNPGISASQLMNSITSTAVYKDYMDDPNVYGSGLLNLDLNAAIPSSSTGTTSSSGGGGGCFIATAVHGSCEAPYVLILRQMRDRFLVTNSAGKAFVRLYYTYSPPVAKIIANHDTLKIAVRIGLLPLVGISWLALKTGPLFTLFILVSAAFLVLGLIRLFSSKLIKRKDRIA